MPNDTQLATDMLLLAKLETLSIQHRELSTQLEDSEIASKPARLIEINKTLAKLSRLVEPYRRYLDLDRQLAEAQTLADDSAQEAEMRELARVEADELRTRRNELLEEIKSAIVTGSEAEIAGVIVEIRAGVGGDEAALFARDLMELYTRFAGRHGWRVETISFSPGELGGMKEVILGVKGEGCYAALAFEGGVHRVQRVPATETQGRIHTSTATVAVMPEANFTQVQIDWDKDVEEMVSCAGGPGGQNVNKVASAVQLRHKATGIEVKMRDERSQHKNRDKARRLLLARVSEHYLNEERAKRAGQRKSMVGTGDRSEKIRTYNFPQNRCTDHRIGYTMNNLGDLMQGNLDDLVSALQTHEKQTRLADLDAWM